MRNCPFCKKDLTETDVANGICRACGRALSSEGTTGTIPEGPTILQAPAATACVEEIEQLWSRSIQPGMTPGMSIKGQGRSVLTPSAIPTLPHKAVKAETDYELLEVLGQGGMGVVYTARQTSVDRTIALKMIKPEKADDDGQKKFLCEAAVTGDLEHPNIVPVYDLGSDEGGQLFYAMKQVKGVSWKEVIRTKTHAENIEILLRVADAVAFAHSKGVVHRDLKPENVMLGDFGEVLVMDWGLALSVMDGGKAERITKETACEGTPAYMAPEMASGNARMISPASDIYLLGAILFEIVTGHAPHAGENVMQCIWNAANNVIQPTEQKGELVDIALKAMATERTQRYLSVKDFQSAIRDCQAHSESIGLAARAQEDLARA